MKTISINHNHFHGLSLYNILVLIVLKDLDNKITVEWVLRVYDRYEFMIEGNHNHKSIITLCL